MQFGFEGKLIFNISKPDGALRRLVDVTQLSSIGWRYTTKIREGLKITYTWYRETQTSE